MVCCFSAVKARSVFCGEPPTRGAPNVGDDLASLRGNQRGQVRAYNDLSGTLAAPTGVILAKRESRMATHKSVNQASVPGCELDTHLRRV